MTYTFGTTMAGTMEDVEASVASALAEEGFGILTRIDVQAVFKQKLGIDRDPYVILGACNPSLSNRLIEADPDSGALLPCNVVLRTDGNEVSITFMDPDSMVSVMTVPEADAVATEARDRLKRVAGNLA